MECDRVRAVAMECDRVRAVAMECDRVRAVAMECDRVRAVAMERDRVREVCLLVSCGLKAFRQINVINGEPFGPQRTHGHARPHSHLVSHHLTRTAQPRVVRLAPAHHQRVIGCGDDACVWAVCLGGFSVAAVRAATLPVMHEDCLHFLKTMLDASVPCLS
jgi:hypothetical protein